MNSPGTKQHAEDGDPRLLAIAADLERMDAALSTWTDAVLLGDHPLISGQGGDRIAALRFEIGDLMHRVADHLKELIGLARPRGAGYDADAVDRKIREARAAQQGRPTGVSAEQSGRDAGRAVAREALRLASPAGLPGAALIAALRDRGFTESDPTLYRWISDWRVPGKQLYRL